MRRLVKMVMLSCAVGSILELEALPIGNPAESSMLIDGVLWEGVQGDPCDPCMTWCDAVSFRAGYYGDYVFDRTLKVDVNRSIDDMSISPGAQGFDAATNTTFSTAVSRGNPALGQHMHESKLFTNAAYMALNIWDRFDVFCTLGGSNGYFKANSAAFNLVGILGYGVKTAVGTNPAAIIAADDRPNVALNQGAIEFYTDTAFSWSIGARGALWECGCATLGAEFQYAQSKPKVQDLNVFCNVAQFAIHNPKGYKNTSYPLPLSAGTAQAASEAGAKLSDAKIDYHEWQLGMALSYRLNMVVPYVGVKWSRASFDADSIKIAQPKLSVTQDTAATGDVTGEILGLTTWNPTLLGSSAITANQTSYAEVLQIVSLQINKMKSRKACGIALGATLVDADKMAVTGEVRLIDERAAHVNAQFRF